MSLTLDAPVFTLEPLSPVLGAAVSGLDLRQPLPAETKRAVYDAFIRYHVLCFRNQHLDPDQQIAFTEQFGTLERHMASNRGTFNPLVHIVSNLGADGKPSGKVASTGWHSDKSFRAQPSLATILHAQVMPPEGGETCFASMIAAYDALAEREKAEVDNIRVVHSWEMSRARMGAKATPEEIADAPPLTHPLVRIIPETGRKALFMGEHAAYFENQPMDEGRARLDALTAHAVEERFVYRHKWRMGDMLMWDNRCLLHRANPNFDAALHPRVLHRTCLRGSAPA
ncbi:MAG: TauD/TfdA family dioxygenase [Acetobacteraceae bacterium]|nr:TauD/TfdA family dioxygenase [Acetobacteraceae bacterium]